jgi:hypothetical protein
LLSISLGIEAQFSFLGPGPSEDRQDGNHRRWKRGFIVTLKGDTIDGKIKTPDFLDVYYDYQRTVSFKDQKTTTEYSPNELKSFSYYEVRDSLVTLQAVSSPEGDGRVFLKLYFNGPCKVYGLTITEVKGGMSGAPGERMMNGSLVPTEKKYIQIKSSQFFPLRRFGFKRNMKEVFATCPRIVSGLDSKAYTYDNWQALVRDYNSGLK